MKHFRSEYAFQKYKPHVSWRKKLLRFFRKKEYVIASSHFNLMVGGFLCLRNGLLL